MPDNDSWPEDKCAFCGGPIASDEVEPMRLTARHADRSETILWTHVDCVGKHLQKEVEWLSRADWDRLIDPV